MADWLLYDELVDLIRNHHHSGFTGLITGVSNEQHSFQVGFHDGQVVLLTYRIFKGDRALEMITQIERAKITQHPNTEIAGSQAELQDTSTILSRLTTKTDKELSSAVIDVVPELSSPLVTATGPSTAGMASFSENHVAAPGNKQLKVIKSAAIHHFGPIGAMVCDEYLSASNLENIELPILLRRIAAEVGANDIDTEAFLNSTD